MQLKSSPKKYDKYKCDFPENTVKKVEKAFKKLGLNLDYKEIKIKSGGFSTYSGFLVIKELGFLTVGKGLTSILAKASAYAEMAERFSSVHFTFYNINFNLEKYYNIIKDIIEKKFLDGFKEKQDFKKEEIALIKNYFDYDFSDKDFYNFEKQGLFENWVDSYSFIKKEKIQVPITFLETISASSGLAAGNTFEEAITQGSCEIFERYAVYTVVSKKIECPTIEIDTIEDERIHRLIEMFNSMNVEVVIKDLAFKNIIPVMGILFINKNFENDKNQLKKDFYFKMLSAGSHPDLSEAIIRCFTERLQETSKHEFMNRKKCDILYDLWTKKLGKKYQRTKDIYYDYFSDYEFEQDLSFLEKGEQISFKNLKSYKNTDALDDYKVVFNICKKNNWDFQVIDYTHNVLKFPTVRVIIPPLSTTHHPYVVDFLKIEDSIKRFNYFYGIKNFFKYVFEDDGWIREKENIKEFIKDVEEYLSKNLSQYSFAMRMGCFYYQINLFYALAFTNLAVNNKKEALEYFRLLYELNESLPCYDHYFNSLQNLGYNPTLFKSYIELIESNLETRDVDSFKLNFNPLKTKNELNEYEHVFEVLLKKIRNSFNS
jgi:ribosomal protein S12 methylthiotransferase accessory factor